MTDSTPWPSPAQGEVTGPFGKAYRIVTISILVLVIALPIIIARTKIVGREEGDK